MTIFFGRFMDVINAWRCIEVSIQWIWWRIAL